MDSDSLRDFLEEKYKQYNDSSFIQEDPVNIPHMFSKQEDIEIAGFLTAAISWGQRKTIIKNAKALMEGMDYSPHEFILGAGEEDLKRFRSFSHRTFNGTDCIFFLRSLRNIYQNHGGPERLFSVKGDNNYTRIFEGIMHFRRNFLLIPHEPRSEKHISDPSRGASAKRLNMFLRWMVRKDNSCIDFGIWNTLNPAELICPLDIHSGRVARKLGLLKRKQNDWRAAMELTEKLRVMDPEDPVRYDIALFCLGVYEKF